MIKFIKGKWLGGVESATILIHKCKDIELYYIVATDTYEGFGILNKEELEQVISSEDVEYDMKSLSTDVLGRILLKQLDYRV